MSPENASPPGEGGQAESTSAAINDREQVQGTPAEARGQGSVPCPVHGCPGVLVLKDAWLICFECGWGGQSTEDIERQQEVERRNWGLVAEEADSAIPAEAVPDASTGALEDTDVAGDLSAPAVQAEAAPLEAPKASGAPESIDVAEFTPGRNGKRVPAERSDPNRSDIFEQARKAISSGLIERILESEGSYWADDEFWTLNPARSDSRIGSFHITAAGLWYDHATGEGGDLIGLIVARDGCDKRAAAETIIRESGQIPATTERPPHLKREERKPPQFAALPVEKAKAIYTANRILEIGLMVKGVTEKLGTDITIAGSWMCKDPDGNIELMDIRFERKGDTNARKDKVVLSFWYDGRTPRCTNAPSRMFGRDLLAQHPDWPVLIVEGGKCWQAAQGIPGVIPVTWNGGAKKVHLVSWSPLHDREVWVWPDNDDAGLQVAAEIKRTLPQAKVLSIPGDKPEKWDIADAAVEGMDLAAFIAQASFEQNQETDAQAELPEEIDDAQSGGGEDEEGGRPEAAGSGEGRGRGPSQGTRLVKLALEQGMEFFHDDRRLYVGLVVGKHRETWPLRSVSFRDLLSHLYFLQHGKSPGGTALEDAIKTLSGKAQFEGKWQEVFVRVAGDDSRILLDLANDSWEAVEITAEGWRIVADPGVRFRRTKGMAPLQTPVHGGSLAELYPFLNTKTAEDLLLVLSWLVMAFRPQGPYPVLCLAGEQGSTKSTVARLLRSLVDPSGAALRSSPRTAEEFFISACNSWCLNIDNLSELKDWLSDSICRVASGAGFAKRTLYTDSDEEIYQVQRPVILNGINEVASRGDLLDRSIVITLPAMQEETRKEESEVDIDFKAKQPSILGALLDAVSVAMRTLPEIHLQTHPRMADFTRWGCAAAAGLNASKEGFLEAYEANRVDADQLAIESSPIGPVILEMIEAGRFVIKWTDTPTKLLALLGDQVGARMDKIKEWPKTPKDLTSAVKRLAPHLRRAGIEVDTGRHSKGRWVSIVKVENGPEEGKS